jgi:hypothetical protein
VSEKTCKLLVSKIVPANPYKKMCRLAQTDFNARSPLPWPITFPQLPKDGIEEHQPLQSIPNVTKRSIASKPTKTRLAATVCYRMAASQIMVSLIPV